MPASPVSSLASVPPISTIHRDSDGAGNACMLSGDRQSCNTQHNAMVNSVKQCHRMVCGKGTSMLAFLAGRQLPIVDCKFESWPRLEILVSSYQHFEELVIQERGGWEGLRVLWFPLFFIFEWLWSIDEKQM